jgi:hypothetical protein
MKYRCCFSGILVGIAVLVTELCIAMNSFTGVRQLLVRAELPEFAFSCGSCGLKYFPGEPWQEPDRARCPAWIGVVLQICRDAPSLCGYCVLRSN